MKKYIMLFIILSVLSLSGCTLNKDDTKGIISKAETTIYKTNDHSENEINIAIDAFKNSFKDGFYKCTLYSVEYGTIDDSTSIETILKNDNNATDALALSFTFKTSTEAYKSLESDQEYTFYAYMIKVDNEWKLISSGELLV